MIDGKFRFNAGDNPARAAIDIYIGIEGNDGSIALAEMEFKEMEPSIRHSPTISIPKEAAQELFNELWRLGFRHRGQNSEAMERHLNDMRKIVAHRLNVKLD